MLFDVVSAAPQLFYLHYKIPTLIARFMGPTGPTPCWPHELCYLGSTVVFSYITQSFSHQITGNSSHQRVRYWVSVVSVISLLCQCHIVCGVIFYWTLLLWNVFVKTVKLRTQAPKLPHFPHLVFRPHVDIILLSRVVLWYHDTPVSLERSLHLMLMSFHCLEWFHGIMTLLHHWRALFLSGN